MGGHTTFKEVNNGHIIANKNMRQEETVELNESQMRKALMAMLKTLLYYLLELIEGI